jgi:hypothetical protein
MEKDFHYFLVYSIAKVTGFANADIIAHASQFVDDNNEWPYSVNGKITSFPEQIKFDGGHYYPIMTQSLSLASLDPYIHKYVYVPFHFLPGDNGVTIKGDKNPLSTTANSGNAKALLSTALDIGDPYQIGIALHTFADTWSHQNFTGLREGWNSVYPWYNIFKSIVPNIGHAEAGHAPDEISKTWIDYRIDDKPIDNRKRALQAVGEIYKALRMKSKLGPFWSDVKNNYKAILRVRRYDDRIHAISTFLTERGDGEMPPYSRKAWPDEALDKTGNEVKLNPNFIDTHWHKFNKAAKKQLAHVLKLVEEL